jgi:hypothetical protein
VPLGGCGGAARGVALDLWRPRDWLLDKLPLCASGQPDYARFPVAGYTEYTRVAASSVCSSIGPTSVRCAATSVVSGRNGASVRPAASARHAANSMASSSSPHGSSSPPVGRLSSDHEPLTPTHQRPSETFSADDDGYGGQRADDEADAHQLYAYQAPRPQNVRYENLAVKFALKTHARRACANLCLLLIILISAFCCLMLVTANNSADYFASQLVALAHQASNASNTSLLAAVAEMLPPTTPNSTLGAATVSRAERCTPEAKGLISGAEIDNLVSGFRYLVQELPKSNRNADDLALLVAVLSCWLVPWAQGFVTVSSLNSAEWGPIGPHGTNP